MLTSYLYLNYRGLDFNAMLTEAVDNSDDTEKISGEKICVIGASHANLFFVFAKSKKYSEVFLFLCFFIFHMNCFLLPK